MRNSLLFILAIFIFSTTTSAQQLKPGFDKAEYIDLMKLSSRFGDSPYYSNIPLPPNYQFLYRSPVMGLHNCWDLWKSTDNVAVISVRGTTVDPVSWLQNFYAAMVPAKGELKLSTTETFSYELATNPKAAVHVGWLVGMAFLSKDMLPKIDSLYKTGAKEIILLGHSQGGAITFLLTAYFYNLQKQGKLPADIRFKTYCSAGPKPGNLYFAYEYEAATQGGWAYNVVNAADWVPEVPFSIQTVNDFNNTNPFVNAGAMIKKQKFPKNIALKHMYNQLSKPTKKAQRNYQKFLGKYTSKMVKNEIPGFEPPVYFESNHYVRTGNTIVLTPDDEYYKTYPDSKENPFMHHLHPPYLMLAEKINFMQTLAASALTGEWELNYISGAKIAFDGLYPNKKPMIRFDAGNKISGNTGCNQFSGTAAVNGNSINFPESMAMTKMFCPGEGEQVFLQTLKKINRYSVSGNTLTLLIDDIAVMRLMKK